MPTTTSPPILVWQPGGGVPVGPISNPPVYSQADVTPLVIGQAYVDVVFGSVQTDNSWVLVECDVVNTADLSPLNIWPGIITNRTTAGFRVWLNGMPDSGNYYLHWAVSGVNIQPVAATLYLFTGSTSGVFGVNHPFTVRLPPSTTLSAPITITPDDGGLGGTFSPPNVVLSSGSASATFIYNAVAYGAATISVTNSGTLIDPASIVFTSVPPVYTFSGPSGGPSGSVSTNFTVNIGGQTLAMPTTITPHDGGGGGTFTPTTLVLDTGSAPQHFTYTPVSPGAKTISVTNNGGLTDPANLTYTATAALLHDGDAVSSWLDSSVNGHDATQSGSARPIFKTAIVNGKPVVRFTSAGLSSLNLASNVSSNWPWCVFVVAKPAVSSSSSLIALSSGSTFHPVAFYYYPGNLFWSDRATYNALGVGTGSAFHVVTVNAPVSGSLAAYVDGSLTGGGPGTPNAAPNDFTTIGSGSTGPVIYSDGDIAEIVVYAAILSLAQRTNIEAYLGAKYAITQSGGGVPSDPSTIPGLAAWWKADSLG